MSHEAPGSYRPSQDVWGTFESVVGRLPHPVAVLIDRRVERLHPKIARLLKRAAPEHRITLVAGEKAKTVGVLEKLLTAMHALPRSGALVCIGGGTLGDLATVGAHLHKRGIRLIQVPTTLLAAVDSSLGGKGALSAGAGRHLVKNAMGVFHYAEETWLCPELFETLSEKQLREGRVEAWKMVATLDAGLWTSYRQKAPSLQKLVTDARGLKSRVCESDPYETTGVRQVLNFGHTFGHVLESVSGFRLSHGDAVGLGMLCALDVGRALRVTDESVAREIETGLFEGAGVLPRRVLGKWLNRQNPNSIETLLLADKKVDKTGRLQMVLVPEVGTHRLEPVERVTWQKLLPSWPRGLRP